MESRTSNINDLRPDDFSFQRKEGHIVLAKNSQTETHLLENRFYYEPILADSKSYTFKRSILGKKIDYPIWISSMTGGSEKSLELNKNLAKLAFKYKLGMGLGSIRPLLFSDTRFKDFNMREIIGEELPFFGNIGIAQIEELLELKNLNKIDEIAKKLNLDGIFIHINLLQEFFQPEGDELNRSPLAILTEALNVLKTPVFIKEVGHGFGPKSLEALLKLPIQGIEYGAFGGTNFSMIEEKRKDFSNLQNPLIFVGHSAEEMTDFLLNLSENDSVLKQKLQTMTIIASGGIKNYLDGFYHLEKLKEFHSLYGQAKEFIIRAHDFDLLDEFMAQEIKSLKIASQVLRLKK